MTTRAGAVRPSNAGEATAEIVFFGADLECIEGVSFDTLGKIRRTSMESHVPPVEGGPAKMFDKLKEAVFYVAFHDPIRHLARFDRLGR